MIMHADQPATCRRRPDLGRLLLLMLGFTLLLTFTAGAAPDNGVGAEVVADDGDRIVLRFTFDNVRQDAVRIDGQAYAALAIEGEPTTFEAGAPALPFIARSIVLPNDRDMELRVVNARYDVIEGVQVAPSKGTLLRTVDPATVPYTFGPAYKTDAFYPGALASLGDPYILRDIRGAAVTVNPCQHNPATGELRLYREIVVELTDAGPAKHNVLRPRPRATITRTFDDIYQSRFLNYETPGRYDPLNELGDMLIIVHDPWVANMQPFANHKTGEGIPTTIVTATEAGGSASAIKNYIQNVYNQSNLVFVLLVGDAGEIPSLSASGGASDPSYSKLAGSDNYPDIIVGRFSAQTAAQVDTQVQRTIDYETLPATTQDWFWKGTGIGSAEGAGIGDDGESDIQHLNNIRTDLFDRGYTVVDQIYDPGASASSVTSALNQGRGFINYTGHGSTYSWGTTGFDTGDINNLNNAGMLPFIVTVACVNGNFDGATCFAEAWMRATDGGQPSGAIGIYASSINQSWAPPMAAQDETVDCLCAEEYACYGALCFAGSCLMMDEYGSDGVSMFNTWHIFGDPSLRVVGVPSGVSVSPSGAQQAQGDAGGPFTPDSFTYTIVNHDDAPRDFTAVDDVNWLSVAPSSGTIPAGGSVNVVAAITSAANAFGNGHYEGNVTFTNTTTHEGDCTRTIMLDIGVPGPVHAFNLNANPGWSMTGQWDYGQPLGSGGDYGNPDPTSGSPGTNVLGVNLAGDYSTNPGGPYALTTQAFDCSELSQVSLHFKRWLNTDYQPYVRCTVEYSLNGSTWNVLWENPSSDDIEDNSWNSMVYDVPEADGESSVRFRWTYQVGNYAWAYSGWNLDEIEIWGLEPSDPPCPCDFTGDAQVDAEDLFDLLGVWGACGGCPQDLDGSGAVDADDLFELLGAWGDCP